MTVCVCVVMTLPWALWYTLVRILVCIDQSKSSDPLTVTPHQPQPISSVSVVVTALKPTNQETLKKHQDHCRIRQIVGNGANYCEM